ncbi:MAG TPA: hypothetical protein DDY68_02410 [Porphyromonadaceae bacterium]|nr:hypothetical protein [Porphyromonadaceae bacterium]
MEDCTRDINRNGVFDGEEEKVYGETSIPFGRYSVDLTFSPKFGRELPILLDVHHFEGIRIHSGNTAKDTLGCILVGENKFKGGLVRSKLHEEMLTEMIRDAKGRGEEIFISIE